MMNEWCFLLLLSQGRSYLGDQETDSFICLSLWLSELYCFQSYSLFLNPRGHSFTNVLVLNLEFVDFSLLSVFWRFSCAYLCWEVQNADEPVVVAFIFSELALCYMKEMKENQKRWQWVWYVAVSIVSALCFLFHWMCSPCVSYSRITSLRRTFASDTWFRWTEPPCLLCMS